MLQERLQQQEQELEQLQERLQQLELEQLQERLQQLELEQLELQQVFRRKRSRQEPTGQQREQRVSLSIPWESYVKKHEIIT